MIIDNALYISDLDGTLLNRSAELSEYAKSTLNALIAGGLNFSVATARTLATADKILDGLELRIPIVLMNGVLVYDTGRKCYLKMHTLQPKTVAAVIQVLQMFEVTGFLYELRNEELVTYHETLVHKPLRDFMDERIARYNKPFRHIDSFSGVSPEHVIYFTLLDTRDRLEPVCDALAAQPGLKLSFYQDVYSSDLWYLEMFSDMASKQSGVDFLRNAYGFERVVGFGDNLNDLPMFSACDVCVAVDNANPAVKAAADCVCGACDSDGVVKWLAGRFCGLR